MSAITQTRWLLAGLGNPGTQYALTRHNIGFRVIEYLAQDHGLTAKQDNKLQALLASGTLAQTPVILAQPLTFMNLSGQAIQKILKFYDIPPDRLLVIYDEAALPFGTLRLRPEGSAAGHNGIKSIIQSLGGRQDFARLRVGIGEPDGPMALKDYVLAKFTPDEEARIPDLLSACQQATETLLTEGIERTMSKFNREVL